MNDNEFYEFEDRVYSSPTVSRDEQLDFISNLRDTMGKESQRIATQTENLGTAVPSDLGGLGGSGSYFQQRYQTMPVENTVANLRATAQAKALNDLMSNYEAQAKNRYSQAYRRASNLASSGGEDDTVSEKLTINTNTGDESEPTTVSTTEWQNALGKINTTPEGKLYYLDATPTRTKTPTYLENLTSADDLDAVVVELGQGYNGQRKLLNGVEYIYLDTGQFAPSWYRVGA